MDPACEAKVNTTYEEKISNWESKPVILTCGEFTVNVMDYVGPDCKVQEGFRKTGQGLVLPVSFGNPYTKTGRRTMTKLLNNAVKHVGYQIFCNGLQYGTVVFLCTRGRVHGHAKQETEIADESATGTPRTRSENRKTPR